MLLLHEVHTVAGRHEDEFEAAFRDGWMPTLGARRRRPPPLLPPARARHRSGVPHASRSPRCATAPRTSGWRRACSAATSAAGPPTSTCSATRSRASCCCPSTGHRCRTSTSRPCPPTAASTTPSLYMEDSAWPHEGALDRYLDKARTHYAPSLEQRTERSLLTLLGVFQAALGAPRRREVVLWQRVDFPERLPGLFTRELPAHVKGPGTWMHDALEVRDDWESRLLRSAHLVAALSAATGVSCARGCASGSRRSRFAATRLDASEQRDVASARERATARRSRRARTRRPRAPAACRCRPR